MKLVVLVTTDKFKQVNNLCRATRLSVCSAEHVRMRMVSA